MHTDAMECDTDCLSSSSAFSIMDAMPYEVKQAVFMFLEEHTLCWINLVSKQWHRYVYVLCAVRSSSYQWRGDKVIYIGISKKYR